MRTKCLAWKSGLAGAIAREKMTIFWLGKPRGVFMSEFVIFPFWGALILRFLRSFIFFHNKIGFLAVSRHSSASSELPASKLVRINCQPLFPVFPFFCLIL